MPKKKKEEVSAAGLLDQIKENYSSMLLGLLVVIIGASLLTRYTGEQRQAEVEKQKVEAEEQKKKEAETMTYNVKEGDSLWTIAQEKTGSGYNWVEYASVNELSSPDDLPVGTELSIPPVTPGPNTSGEIAAAETSQVTLKESSYVVAEGDSLWKIAVRAYGDGYMWVKLAEANKISNPDIINPGMKLTLPR